MKRLPFLSNADRRALLVLEWIFVLGFLGFCVYSWHQEDGKQVAVPDRGQKCSAGRDPSADPIHYAVPEEVVETFPFDPNTADSTTLLRLGLAPWQVRSIYRYRAKHGRYHTPEDFKRLPGMTVELWARLGPSVRIAEKFRYLSPSEVRPSAGLHDSVPRTVSVSLSQQRDGSPRDTVQYPIKFESQTVVDLNTADTMVLKKIPGIASYRAGKIVAYRARLGGYVRVEQVMEACPLPDEVLPWFVVSSPQPRQLNINRLSVSQMMKHPYISFYQAKAIYEYRKEYGNISSLDVLLRLDHFSSSDVERLRPYVEL